jgi:hypothetical protein
MKRLFITVLCCCLYAIGVCINAGFALAGINYEGAFGIPSYMCAHYESDRRFAFTLSLIPISWVVFPAVTGFYAHGWRLSQLSDCQKEKL